MTDNVKKPQRPEAEDLEGQEAELLPERAAMSIIYPPSPLPVVPTGGGDTILPPIDYT